MIQLETRSSLALASADQLATAAVDAASAAGLRICVAVCDAGGELLTFKRMSGAPLHSTDLAIDKAYTAISFGRPTQDWDRRLAKGSEQLRLGLMQRPRFVGFGGGMPVIHEGQRIGAIGISGGSEAQDAEIATAALAVFGSV